MPNLKYDEWRAIVHALFVAAERFKLDAADCGHERLAEQFRKQQMECLALIEKIEADI